MDYVKGFAVAEEKVAMTVSSGDVNGFALVAELCLMITDATTSIPISARMVSYSSFQEI